MKKFISMKLAAVLLASGLTGASAEPDKGAQVLVAYGVAVALMIWAGSSNNSHAAELKRFDINKDTSLALKTQLGDVRYFSLINEMATGSPSSILTQKYFDSELAKSVIDQYAKTVNK